MEWGEKENQQLKHGLGEKKAGEPVDFVLMPPIHGIRFWYHDLMGKNTDC